ncbi:hypothetical protein KCP75_15385 [Salmonella enterica subsp. enterica]|nr:hypothetical protein KCP75_15385 [Salmonella enterica subsp. enterica]
MIPMQRLSLLARGTCGGLSVSLETVYPAGAREHTRRSYPRVPAVYPPLARGTPQRVNGEEICRAPVCPRWR